MESKNISSHGAHMREVLEKGYAELAAERWNFAHIVFDKALTLEEDCAGAYAGKVLADMQCKSLAAAAQSGRAGDLYRGLIFSSDKIRMAVFADAELKKELFECGYDYADKCGFEDMKMILGFLGEQGYREAESKMYIFDSYAELERKAEKYRDEYVEKLKAETKGVQIKTSASRSGKKKLIENKDEIKREYPGVAKELESLDYAYREAQVAGSFTTKTWVIAIILFIVYWPAAVVYLIFKSSKGTKDAPKMDTLEKDFARIKKRYKELNEELRFTLETMLEEDIQTFEYEAAGLGMMVGYGKKVIDKYSDLGADIKSRAENVSPKSSQNTQNKGAYKVELISFGTQKLSVIKAVREITGLGLYDAKNIVENAPSTVKNAESREEAEKIKRHIESAGGTVRIY